LPWKKKKITPKRENQKLKVSYISLGTSQFTRFVACLFPSTEVFLARHRRLTPRILAYLGGRDQEDHSSKPAWANRLRDPISK
jgi:hypothetical protein